jgi:hypothetical protein
MNGSAAKRINMFFDVSSQVDLGIYSYSSSIVQSLITTNNQ